jgi:hypothetical protein
LTTKAIKQAVALAQKPGHVFVATADAEGLPHVAAAATMNYAAENKVAVSAWFCPGTLSDKSNKEYFYDSNSQTNAVKNTGYYCASL